MSNSPVPALAVRNLTKHYSRRGSHTAALQDVSFEVPTGSVFGFVGRNGAGKTTTLRIATALAHATTGAVEVCGIPATEPRARAHVAFVPDVPAFYPWMTAAETIQFAGRMHAQEVTAATVQRLLALAGLSGNARPVGTFSRGMRQRLGIVQALVGAPRLLLLDEPTSALDPLGRRDVLNLVSQLTGRVTVLFSSHILADVEEVCSHAAVLDAGQLRACGTLRHLRDQATIQPGFELEVVRDAPRVAAELAHASWCTSATATSPTHVTVSLADAAQLDQVAFTLPQLVAQSDCGLRDLHQRHATLADAFYQLVGTPQEGTR